MPRPEKVQAVAEIKERLAQAEAVFVAEYSGLSVTEQQQLRRGLKEAGGEFKVVKMTLARLAASELGHDDLLEMLVGPTGLAFASGDAAVAAKALRDFGKDHDRLVIKGALLGAEVLPPERVSQLADLEPRDVLLARVAGVLQAPMATMAGLLAAMPRAMANMVLQLIERMPAAEADEPAAPTGSTDEPSGDEPDDEPSGDEPGTDVPSDDEPAAPRGSTDEPSDDESSGDESSGDEPSSDEPSDDEPSGDEPSDDEPSDDVPSDDVPSGDDPSDDEAADAAEEE
jgi:large subunit ribosomal protein L10